MPHKANACVGLLQCILCHTFPKLYFGEKNLHAMCWGFNPRTTIGWEGKLMLVFTNSKSAGIAWFETYYPRTELLGSDLFEGTKNIVTYLPSFNKKSP